MCNRYLLTSAVTSWVTSLATYSVTQGELHCIWDAPLLRLSDCYHPFTRKNSRTFGEVSLKHPLCCQSFLLNTFGGGRSTSASCTFASFNYWQASWGVRGKEDIQEYHFLKSVGLYWWRMLVVAEVLVQTLTFCGWGYKLYLYGSGYSNVMSKRATFVA